MGFPLPALRHLKRYFIINTTIPVLNSNTKPTQYLPTRIIIIIENMGDTKQLKCIALFSFFRSLISYCMQGLLFSCLVALHIELCGMLHRFCAGYSTPQGLLGPSCSDYRLGVSFGRFSIHLNFIVILKLLLFVVTVLHFHVRQDECKIVLPYQYCEYEPNGHSISTKKPEQQKVYAYTSCPRFREYRKFT